MTHPVAIHHNPDCGTSRNVLRIIEAAGYTPITIDYLKTGWSRPQLLGLFAAADLTARTALRIERSPADQMGLTRPDCPEDTILAAMCRHPILVNRPIVCTPRGVRLCRPSETVLALLERWPAGPFAKEDGTVILDGAGAPAN